MIFEFELPGHVTRRDWAVYIVIVKGKKKQSIKLYVGKTGDNRDGCNPIISRIGNHLSFNKIHSQLRNKIEDTINSEYRIVYYSFGAYETENRLDKRQITNQAERELNSMLISAIKNRPEFQIVNPFKGVGVTNKMRLERGCILSNKEKRKLNELIVSALQKN